jgi:DNA-binding NarL/FixJ family response regulator
MSNQKPTIILADDHPILLKGLGDFLSDLGYIILGTAKDGLSAFNLIKEFSPDLAILDMEMPLMTGLEIAAKCQGQKTKIILLTFHKELYLYQQAKELNLSGYILKEFALDDLSTAISKIMEGGQFFSEKIFEELMEDSIDQNENPLTPSEIKIVRLIAQGLSSKEIAELLFVSERTVEKHRSNMISKLNLEKKHNSLLVWAQQNKKIIS